MVGNVSPPPSVPVNLQTINLHYIPHYIDVYVVSSR